ncbi:MULTISPECIES: acyl carrier protein [Aeromicrobium]|uniref:Acyl carrier protein n=1 Tax=Aeromicrobium fastidiosum TaxID=52699 RepID=A0A641ALJ5_9ACTN|nr:MULTISPECIES: acyl carrier protein [Aeromicrobium]KAA1378160.1 acyl carrier protein [Aeromicrobium fastidiosum]MBD8607942.1 acyl carrier protein [Aeromicrobium sp. CFBP 8757]MBP2389035.1 acyl carrier protein [Aeromicrobium fastidiosum]
MDQRQVEDLILELIADGQHRDAKHLRAELEALGEELPIDSLFAVEVLAQVEDRCGVTLSTDPERAAAMKSVKLFAAAIVAELEKVQRASAGGEMPA